MIVAILLTVFALFVLFAMTVPYKCWAMMRQNAYRLDGSFSQRRNRRENRALAAHAANLFVPLLFFGLTVFISTAYFFERVMPLSMVDECVGALTLDSDRFPIDVENLQRSHHEVMSAKGFSEEEITAIQQSLWHDWPVVMGSVLVFLVICYFIFVAVAAGSVKELVLGIRHRRKVYARADVAGMRDKMDEIRIRQMPGVV